MVPYATGQSNNLSRESADVRHAHRTPGKRRGLPSSHPVDPLHARHGRGDPAGPQPGGRPGHRRGTPAVRHRRLPAGHRPDPLDQQGPGAQGLPDALRRSRVTPHVYQTGEGGTTFCPLERDARIILTSTPRFAKQVSHKYGEGPAARVVKDQTQNHGRPVAESFVQNTAAAVAAVVQAKEEQWQYATPKLQEPVHSIGVGVDGTCMFVVQDGHRQAMVGSISLYDRQGQRHHTIYVAATPEYGKERFYRRMSAEIEHVRRLYPDAHLSGIADGSEDNWTFLRQHTQDECVDFYHATAYL